MEVVLRYVCLYSLVVPIFAWNVDTRIPVIFSGFKDSYFGFSVALHDNSNGSFGLVSATRANSTFSPRESLHQPGVLYKCNITTAKCEEVILERTANATNIEESVKQDDEAPCSQNCSVAANNVSYVGRPMSYVAKEDDMWLGISLDVQSTGKGNILTCGHLWKNQHYQKHYLTNGACYIIDRDFNRSSYKILLPLIHRDQQTVQKIYYYAFALAGMSAAFSEDDADIVIGAPGFYDWTGTVLSYNIPDNPSYAMLPVVPDPPGEQQPSSEAYIGYSVSTGKFFEIGNLQYVTGAPRDGDNKGRVYIFESLHHNQRDIVVTQRLQGEKIGEYFGACVVGINVNGDSYTDLFVGSPFYSLPGGGDEGKVYVYISNGLGLRKYRELMGSRKPESRFGTTIANAGDLNQDGFLDVAIGAPYEDGKGAIYIYHGKNSGINDEYIQRIAAKEINPLLSGFGISISRGKDIDDNFYSDILVGSYASDHAVLFRTRPIVKLFGKILFDPPQIDPNSSVCHWNGNVVPCFNVSFCLQYTGKHVPHQIDISTDLTSDRKKDVPQSRRYLLLDNKLFAYRRQNITVTEDTPHCISTPAYIASDPKDYINPIQMTLNFKLTHDVTKEESFCKSCPMLHPDFPTTIIRKITYQTGCGEDGICISDLNVKVNVHGLSSGELIVGQDNVITLAIELQNSKDPAYMTELFIYIPPDVQIINQGNCKESQLLSVLVTIACEAGNPLPSGHTAKFEIKLDTSRVSTTLDQLIIHINSTTASQEANPADNKVDVKIPLKVLADITIIGYPEIEQIIFGKKQQEIDSVDIVHVYTVLKYLPSPINSVSVDMLIPTTFMYSNVEFLHLKYVRINERSIGSAVPANCNFTTIDVIPVTSEYEDRTETTEREISPVLPTPRPKRSIRKRSINNEPVMVDSTVTTIRNGERYTNYILDCASTVCTRISCIAGPFTHRSPSSTFRIYGVINITALNIALNEWDKITLVTEGKVAIRDQRKTTIQPYNHRPDETKVVNTIEYASPLPPRRISIWIIAISIAAGVLLLILISLGLIKLGFFRRKQKEDMEKMMMKAELEEWKPYMVADKDANGEDSRRC